MWQKYIFLNRVVYWTKFSFAYTNVVIAVKECNFDQSIDGREMFYTKTINPNNEIDCSFSLLPIFFYLLFHKLWGINYFGTLSSTWRVVTTRNYYLQINNKYIGGITSCRATYARANSTIFWRNKFIKRLIIKFLLWRRKY